ncbi:MAG: hypothetical protein QOF61_623 [Acidobacteriota bacterium]|nr:hypothetical protein [Acidobacteriota bacterium]
MIEDSQVTPEVLARAETPRGVRADADVCRVCGNAAGNHAYHAREMFAGTREPFTYVECAACGTLQLRDVPDLARYYSGDYYSLTAIADVDERAGLSAMRRLARSLGARARRGVAAYYCARRATLGAARHPIGWLASRALKRYARDFPAYLKDAAYHLKLDLNSAVLDVGSGAGTTLLLLSQFGFRDLTGIDPFLDADISYPSGVRVLKAELCDLSRQFDLILANHSVEHVSDPRETLKEIRRLLKAGRYAIVRIPVAARAWQLYGADWVQLDPPRHLHLFTAAKFRALAEDEGFGVDEVRHDSTAFQFWGSEQYVRDIPLSDARSYLVNPEASVFSREQIARWEDEAAHLNARGEGDQAIFYLRKR